MDKVVLFDGVCNLCNSTVQKLIEWDKDQELKFSSLQSNFGQEVISDTQLNQTNLNTVMYMRGNQIYTKSNAAIEVLYDLGGLWKLARVFYIVPKFLRNKIYDYIATNRYQWFGKKESCWLPTPELKQRFLN